MCLIILSLHDTRSFCRSKSEDVALRYIFGTSGTYRMKFEDVPLVEFMYIVFTRMPGESYRRRLRSLLLCLRDVFRTLINSLVC